MSDALVTQLARVLHLPPDAARHTLDHLVATLREQIDATGRAEVPGLGTFLRGEDGLTFRPDDALTRAVNHRYAGLRPIEAGPRAAEEEREAEPEDPFAKAAPSAAPSEPEPSETVVGFQPLDSFIEPEEAEPAGEQEEVEEAPAAEAVDPELTVASEEAGAALPPPDEEELGEEEVETVEPEVETAEPELEAGEAAEAEPAAEVEHEVVDLPAETWPALAETADEEHAFDAVPPEDVEEADYDVVEPEDEGVLDATGEEEPAPAPNVEAEPEIEPEAEPEFETEQVEELEPETAEVLPAAEDESDELDSLADLAVPEDNEAEEDEDDLEATTILPVMSPPAAPPHAAQPPPLEPKPEAAPEPAPEAEPPAGPQTVAPAVAATSRAFTDREPAGRRRVPVFLSIIGIAAVLSVVALLWLLNREPGGPIAADQPAPLDTTTAVIEAPPTATDTTGAAAPVDTAAVAEAPPEPAEPVTPANPLQGSAPIDPAAGGWTWVVASEASQGTAERRAARYREQGLRTGVIAGEAGGATRYRVGLGQFRTLDEANRFRPDLPAGVPEGTWLLQL